MSVKSESKDGFKKLLLLVAWKLQSQIFLMKWVSFMNPACFKSIEHCNEKLIMVEQHELVTC